MTQFSRPPIPEHQPLTMQSWDFAYAQYGESLAAVLPDGVDPYRARVEPVTDLDTIKAVKSNVYDFLDEQLPKSEDLAPLQAQEHSLEPVVAIGTMWLGGHALRGSSINGAMEEFVPSRDVYVRPTVMDALVAMTRALDNQELWHDLKSDLGSDIDMEGVALHAFYGLRPAAVQLASHNAEIKRLLAEGMDPSDMAAVKRQANMQSADPSENPTHPTAADIDWQLTNFKGHVLQHGQDENRPSKNDKTFSPFVSYEQGAVREFMRRLARVGDMYVYPGEVTHAEIRNGSVEGVWAAHRDQIDGSGPDISHTHAKYDVFVPRNGFPLKEAVEYPVAA